MIRKLFRILMIISVTIFLLIVVISGATWYQTKKSLARYCRETTAGTSLVDAHEKARQSGFHFLNYSSAGHKAYVTATGVMGRYICEIEHDGKRVIKTRLNFND
ncbi:hypothetical protein [Geomobilimonas luticola]|uniref:PepSY domain-containing protein n=1 Tax=Geomobilimonas luticola TaxID=1114878 RepID=A0ABS5SEX5_9BACT|nr:hypothetical protein [Geomobilimonas luticola]MBT0653069.1 hypothetical protein [Geomobilimonas luticola]